MTDFPVDSLEILEPIFAKGRENRLRGDDSTIRSVNPEQIDKAIRDRFQEREFVTSPVGCCESDPEFFEPVDPRDQAEFNSSINQFLDTLTERVGNSGTLEFLRNRRNENER